ncbi:hypothetical protein DK389_12350 [Methylobacterium durans]|uniref:Uncharacterized protein n=1 Tax=Methylobacterium durans TaxID=2202825 RepID=A0A2U8W6A8_9HYPH|nr:hypothetical protein DK389_12350 [Methylobacterium durans]
MSQRGHIGVILIAALSFVLASTQVKAQSCRWAGTAPFCAGECGSDEQEVSRLDAIPSHWIYPFVNVNPPFGAGCATGTKALCCKVPGGSSTRSCRWDGTAPFCAGSCNTDESRATPPEGSSSGAGCWTGSKVYCCKSAGTVRQPLTGARDCSYGPDTCVQGLIWREANPNDHVCVTPDVRDQAQKDNSQAAARRSPTGGPSGPDACIQGFVWREAFPGDHVCVLPEIRSGAALDNGWADVRKACP